MSLREREYRVTQLLELSEDKKSVVGVIEKKPIVNSARVYLKEDVDIAVRELKKRIGNEIKLEEKENNSFSVGSIMAFEKSIKIIEEVFEWMKINYWGEKILN